MRLACLATVALLTGCGLEGGNLGGSNDDVCSSYPPRIVHLPADSPEKIRDNLDSCVQHWAARLSLGNDPAETVAQAAVVACKPGITDLIAELPVQIGTRNAIEESLRDLALFRAVQQRAGKCGIPDLGPHPLTGTN